MRQAEEQKVIQTFAAQRSDEPLHKRLAVGGVDRRADDFHTLPAQGVVKLHGELPIAGGVVCFPSFWALRDKVCLTLSETRHPVPGLNDAMDRQIDTFTGKVYAHCGLTDQKEFFAQMTECYFGSNDF